MHNKLGNVLTRARKTSNRVTSTQRLSSSALEPYGGLQYRGLNYLLLFAYQFAATPPWT